VQNNEQFSLASVCFRNRRWGKSFWQSVFEKLSNSSSIDGRPL
jgi:hypothetical protein